MQSSHTSLGKRSFQQQTNSTTPGNQPKDETEAQLNARTDSHLGVTKCFTEFVQSKFSASIDSKYLVKPKKDAY